LSTTVQARQEKQKQQHDIHARERKFQEGEEVYVRQFQRSDNEAWIEAVVSKVTGPVSLEVKLGEGRVRRCHVDQVRKRYAEGPSVSPQLLSEDVDISREHSTAVQEPELPRPEVESQPTPSSEPEPPELDTVTPEEPSRASPTVTQGATPAAGSPTPAGGSGIGTSTPLVRRSRRRKHFPDYYSWKE